MDKIIIPGVRVFRTFAQKHPELIFVYGNDWAQKGFFGQANHLFGESNTFSVPTLYKVCHSQSDRYYSDDQWETNTRAIDERIEKIPKDGRPIIWLPKLGRGHSQLYVKAPKTYNYLVSRLMDIGYPNVVWDYNQQIY